MNNITAKNFKNVNNGNNKTLKRFRGGAEGDPINNQGSPSSVDSSPLNEQPPAFNTTPGTDAPTMSTFGTTPGENTSLTNNFGTTPGTDATTMPNFGTTPGADIPPEGNIPLTNNLDTPPATNVDMNTFGTTQGENTSMMNNVDTTPGVDMSQQDNTSMMNNVDTSSMNNLDTFSTQEGQQPPMDNFSQEVTTGEGESAEIEAFRSMVGTDVQQVYFYMNTNISTEENRDKSYKREGVLHFTDSVSVGSSQNTIMSLGSVIGNRGIENTTYDKLRNIALQKVGILLGETRRCYNTKIDFERNGETIFVHINGTIYSKKENNPPV